MEPLSWSHIASGLGAITVVLIGYLIYQGNLRDSKTDKLILILNTFVTKDECSAKRQDCTNSFRLNEIGKERRLIWDKHDDIDKDFKSDFYRHSHTELTDHSVVKIK